MAIVNSLFNGTCYATSAAAVDAYFSQNPPITATNGKSTWVVENVQVAGVWQQRQTTYSNTGLATVNYTVNAAVPTFPACDPLQGFNDGMALAIAVSTATVLVVLATLIKRAI